jgi:S1-C subfamily serine protease
VNADRKGYCPIIENEAVHSPVSTAVSLSLLILIVGGSFAYVSLIPMPWIGIEGTVLTPEVAREFGLQKIGGLLIVTVEPDSPADQAGLKENDVIVGIDDREIKNAGDVEVAEMVLNKKQIGDTVKFTINRADRVQDVIVTIGEKLH